MNVRQLIALLEKVEDKDNLVFVKSGEKSEGCCGGSSTPDWEEATEFFLDVGSVRAYSKDKGTYWKNVPVVKLDVY
jgi:membrane protease subunit (stomatin/prohibitin family)